VKPVVPLVEMDEFSFDSRWSILKQSTVVGMLSELVFGLNDVVPPFAEQPLEDATDMFVQENPDTGHWTVSLGFSEDSRTRSKASSFFCSISRISSTLS
jgi:hypothetical protein